MSSMFGSAGGGSGAAVLNAPVKKVHHVSFTRNRTASVTVSDITKCTIGVIGGGGIYMYGNVGVTVYAPPNVYVSGNTITVNNGIYYMNGNGDILDGNNSYYNNGTLEVIEYDI